MATLKASTVRELLNKGPEEMREIASWLQLEALKMEIRQDTEQTPSKDKENAP